MNIPIELIGAIGSVLLAFILNNQRSSRRRIERLEKQILTIIIMLRDRGFRIPEGDTERLLKTDIKL